MAVHGVFGDGGGDLLKLGSLFECELVGLCSRLERVVGGGMFSRDAEMAYFGGGCMEVTDSITEKKGELFHSSVMIIHALKTGHNM